MKIENHWLISRDVLETMLERFPEAEQFAVWIDDGILSFGPHDQDSRRRVTEELRKAGMQ